VRRQQKKCWGLRVLLGYVVRSVICQQNVYCYLSTVNGNYFISVACFILYLPPPPSPSPRWELDLVTSRVVFCVGILGAILALLTRESD